MKLVKGWHSYLHFKRVGWLRDVEHTDGEREREKERVTTLEEVMGGAWHGLLMIIIHRTN